MKVLPPLRSIRRNLNETVTQIRESRFFHDRLSMPMLVVALAIGVFNAGLLLLHVPVVGTDVPVRYSSLRGFDGLGPWYSPFFIVLFGFSVSIVNGVLAYQVFDRSRIASFYLLAGAGVVALFCLIISNAFSMVGQ